MRASHIEAEPVRGRPSDRTFMSLFSLDAEFAILMIVVEVSVEC